MRGFGRKLHYVCLLFQFDRKESDMNTNPVLAGSVIELTTDEIDEVSGGVVFIAPVLIKIGAWGLGAAFGAGGVVFLTKYL